MWKRQSEEEHQEMPRKWVHEKSGDEVRVEQYQNGTWDTFRNERLIENYDEQQEAVRRGRKIVD